MATIVVPTSQNIELEYPVANLMERGGAAMLDLLVILVYSGTWGWIYDKYPFDDSLLLLVLLPSAFYSLISELIFNGQSLGKLVTKTKVIRLDGSEPGFSDFLLRWMMRLIDMWLILPLYGVIAAISSSVNKKGQRLGDILAGTTIIKLKLATTFEDTMFWDTADDYEIVFHEIEKLSDRDMSILKEVLDIAMKHDNDDLLEKLAKKVAEVANIETNMPHKQFLDTILQDYNHLFGKK